MRHFLFIATAIFFSSLAHAQKIAKEKISVNIVQYPLVMLPDTVGYSSNDFYLKLLGRHEVPENTGYTLVGVIYPNIRHENTWYEELRSPDILFSTPIKIKIKDRLNRIVYYRIFNSVCAESIQVYRPNEVEAMTYSKLSTHLSFLFLNREKDQKVKIQYVKSGEGYTEINEAYKICLEGLTAYNSRDFKQSKQLISQSIAIWEGELGKPIFRIRRPESIVTLPLFYTIT